MSRAAIRYAKAILDIAQSSGKAEAVNADMMSIMATVRGSHELSVFLASPVIKLDKKRSAIGEIFSDVQSETVNLFDLLAANKRFEILNSIAKEYNRLYDESNGIEVAKVTTAFPITDDLKSKVLAKVAQFSNKKITLQNVVDPSIIGGFILRVGDQQYNASVAAKLSELKREFAK
ncbi:ATP synthase F1 subunit delta [Flavobacterium aciduliphilum]|jgi:F-type H+-transporting ATPase subunit delta|uniref:ATP synthase subunit delta n=1 Tax=Flavobacterium aciduliphilum TaxID=1101402 RepID=A0A328YBL9_9FLAO|nr:ATP synthase F1 subunit delta [Flavobacterium aciduliphilum]RAR71329.1 ATP synthase F1 subcomplex delta subunit [Flavobacterium aciduliphilum]